MGAFTSGTLTASEVDKLNWMHDMLSKYPSRIAVAGPLLQPVERGQDSQIIKSLQINMPFWAQITDKEDVPAEAPVSGQTRNLYRYSWVKRRQGDTAMWVDSDFTGTFNAYQFLGDGEVESPLPIGATVLMFPSNANLGSFEFLADSDGGGGSGSSSGSGTGDSGTSSGSSSTSASGTGTGTGTGTGSGGTQTTFEIITDICPIYTDSPGSGTGSSSSTALESASGSSVRSMIGLRLTKRLVTFPGNVAVGPETCETVTDGCEPCVPGSGTGSATGSGTSTGSGAAPIVTNCGTIPSVLYVEVSTGESFTITYDSGASRWIGTYGPTFTCPPALSFGLIMRCVGSSIEVGVVASWRGPASTTPSSLTISPFLLTYVGMDDGCGGFCSTAPVSFTISEVP
jgi:hypothetical protein